MGSSQPRDWTQVSSTACGFYTDEPPGKPMNTGVGSLSLLQGIFPTEESNWSLLHCRQILYWLSCMRSLNYLAQLPRFSKFWVPSLSPLDQWSFVVCLVTKSCPTLLWPHGLWPARLLCPWNFLQQYWSGLPLPSGDLPDPGIEPMPPALQADSLLLSHQGSPMKPML